MKGDIISTTPVTIFIPSSATLAVAAAAAALAASAASSSSLSSSASSSSSSSSSSSLSSSLSVLSSLTSIQNMAVTGGETSPIESDFNLSDGFIEELRLYGLYETNYTRLFFNGSFNNTQQYSPCPTIQNSIGNTLVMILYAIVCIVGLFGNTLVIYVVLRFSKMQTVTNMYILNLALADECYLIGIPFLLITMYLGNWTFGEGMCKAYMVSTSITQFTSSIFLFIMSADRYIAVCHPISSPRFRTPLVSKIVSGIAWTASAVIMLPVILFASTIEYQEGKNSCILKWPEDQSTQSGTTFTLYSLILGFAIPLSFIMCFYYLVIRKLHTVGPKNKSKEKKRSHRKVTKLVLTVITVYVLCWLPHWISQVALIHSPPQNCRSRLELTIFLLVGCLGYSNSAMNPILYAFLSDNFKKSFLKACTCATGKDINAQLQLENSMFPKFGKNSGGSERLLSSSTRKHHQKQHQQQQQQQQQHGNRHTTNTAATSAISGTVETAATAITADSTTVLLPGNSGVGGSGPKSIIATTTITHTTTISPTTTTIKSTIIETSGSGGGGADEKPPVLHTDL